MKLQPSLLVTIITASIAFGGFYYTTTHRLDNIESKVEKLEKKVKKRRNK